MTELAKNVEVVTFGCRLNLVESQAIRGAISTAGQDNLIVVNTCAVTSEAVRQARQKIRRLKREMPSRRVVVTGCAAQTEAATFAKMPEVAFVIGNEAKTKTETWQHLDVETGLGLASLQRVRVGDIMRAREAQSHFRDGIDGHTRAFVQVQTGCDHRCTFCIIPFGRGNSRSVPTEILVEQIGELCERGYREVVLTGVDITSFGQDLPGQPCLGALVGQVLRQVPALKRLRLSSIDCIEIDARLLEAMTDEPRLMPHLHLSLQSGDDLVLKRMKRRHTRAQAASLCAELRRRRPDIVFGADFIVGFPTETEAQFQETLALVEDCGLTHLHVFPYSVRPGTPAARMPQVAAEVIRERATRLRALGTRRRAAHLAVKLGTTGEVLMERGAMGRLTDFTPVKLAGAMPATFVKATIIGHDGKILQGSFA